MANSRRSATFMLGKVAIEGTVTTGLPTGAATAAKQPALGTAGTPSADVITVQGSASGTALPVKAAANTTGTYVGDVVVALAASLYDVAEATQSGTATQLASHANVFGTTVTNTHASAILYVGSSSVSTTRFLYKLLAGESSPLIPVNNSNLLFVKESASCTYTYGGL